VAKDLTEAMRQLTEGGAGQTSRTNKTLPASNAAPAIPARSGSSGPKSSSSGSIASPLTETAYADRTYHAAKTISSTDGLLTWEVEPINKVYFTDLNGAPVEMIYQSP
jgi:hypothetical protein